MSDIELAVTGSKRIEKLLEDRLGAVGRGLHEKVSSVERLLPERIVKMTRFVASVRNAIVHGDEEQMRDRAGFERAVAEVEAYLEEISNGLAPRNPVRPIRVTGGTSGNRILVLGVIVIVILVLLGAYVESIRP